MKMIGKCVSALGLMAVWVAMSIPAQLRAQNAPGVMLGVHNGTDSTPKEDLVKLETAIGRKFAIDNDMEDWVGFPNIERAKWDIQNGRLSMLSWRIVFHRYDTAAGCATADAIVAGTYDAQLQKQAAKLKALGTPVLVRYNYEMTNNEENTCFTGFEVKSDPKRAGTKYIAAWKYIVDKFRAAGAMNVKWVWAPGNIAYIDGDWRLFYPGDDYVDWIGVDDYNKTDVPESFATNPGILAFYAATSSLGKPLMIAETGAVNDPKLNPDAQTLWLTTARGFLKANPAIKALCYWNSNGKYQKEHPGYGGSGYYLQGSGLAAFKAMANDPYFLVTASQP